MLVFELAMLFFNNQLTRNQVSRFLGRLCIVWIQKNCPSFMIFMLEKKKNVSGCGKDIFHRILIQMEHFRLKFGSKCPTNLSNLHIWQIHIYFSFNNKIKQKLNASYLVRNRTLTYELIVGQNLRGSFLGGKNSIFNAFLDFFSDHASRCKLNSALKCLIIPNNFSGKLYIF